MNQVVDFINVNRDRYVDELKQYLAIPSISALPEHAGDVRRAAEWTADACRAAGLENVKLIETPGNPVVYGDWLHAPGKPTILFYGHYDVQPVDPVNLWTSPPFEATVRDGEIYARGAADDKGQVFMHIKAIEAHLKKNGSLPINMKFFIEGEEEVGSAHLDEFVRGHKQELTADVVVISDSPMFDRGIPSICYGLRGLAYFQIDLRGTRSDLHSGSFGGAVANPAFVLGQILAQMKDRSGHIKIPGFYDDVRPLSDAERAEWKKLPFNETKYRKELGAPRLFGESGYSTLERVWARPTFEVNGLLSGFTGEGAKTVLPATAMAKVSMRLVPDQHPDKVAQLFEAYLNKIAPKTVELKLTRMHGGKPWMTEFDNKFVRAAGKAIERGFGQAPVFNREGGSIPVVSTFQEELGLPSVLFGVGLPDENAHAPDEKLDLGNFHNGIIASAFLYDEIAQLDWKADASEAIMVSPRFRRSASRPAGPRSCATCRGRRAVGRVPACRSCTSRCACRCRDGPAPRRPAGHRPAGMPSDRPARMPADRPDGTPGDTPACRPGSRERDRPAPRRPAAGNTPAPARRPDTAPDTAGTRPTRVHRNHRRTPPRSRAPALPPVPRSSRARTRTRAPNRESDPFCASCCRTLRRRGCSSSCIGHATVQLTDFKPF